MKQTKPHNIPSAKKQHLISFLSTIIAPHSKTMLLGLLCLITVNILLLFIPYIFSTIIDNIITENKTLSSFSLQSRSMVYTYALLGVSILIFILRIGWRSLLIIPSFKIENTLKKHLFQHFLQFSQKSQEKISTGEQVSLVERETQQLTQAISWGTLALADGIFTVISVYTILIIGYREIAWASLPLYPIAFIYAFFLFKNINRQYEKIQGKIAGISELTRAMFENIATIKSHNSELFYQNKFLQEGKDIVKTQIRISFLTSMMWPLFILVNGISLVCTLYFGIRAYTLGTASIGDIFAVISYIAQVELPFLGLGFAFDIQQKGLSTVRRIQKSLTITPNVYTTHTTTQTINNPTSIKGALHIDNLVFHYKNEEALFQKTSSNKNRPYIHTDTHKKPRDAKTKHFTLGPITLHSKAGTWIGITGKIGSGKSTLAKLITRIYETEQSNAIQWDNIPIQALDLSLFRQQVFYQAQDFHLFSVSIAQNIAFNEEELSKHVQEKAITFGTYSALEQDVSIFPQQWHTQIGEDGILLSGGQKQRISLARTLYAQIPVLILDDIFSGLDNQTSKQVLQNLLNIRNNKTTIIISHNLPIISNTDKIIVMDNGKIIEEGTHFNLLKNPHSVYSTSWKEYLIDQGEYYE